MIYTCKYVSPLGAITLAGDGDALTGLWFDGQRYFGSTLPPDAKEGRSPVFDEARRWLDVYFSRTAAGLHPAAALWLHAVSQDRLRHNALHPVWADDDLQRDRTARRGGAWARVDVGAGCRRRGRAQPISIIIPCHRVTGTNGSLTGYAGGIDPQSAATGA